MASRRRRRSSASESGGGRRGMLGGDRTWMIIGGILWARRTIRRTAGRTPTLVSREVLKPGQFVSIQTIRPPTRQERKALKSSK